MSLRVSRHYFLWTKSTCPFCKKASDILAENRYPHTIYTLDSNPELLQKAKEKFNWETVPLVLEQSSDGESKFIGGCSDLETYLETLND